MEGLAAYRPEDVGRGHPLAAALPRLLRDRPAADYGPLTPLLKGQVNARLIAASWDEALRVAASIRHGTVSAALLMRKLAACPRQNQIARALHDIGQLEKTVFVLELLLDPHLRRRQRRGLNDGESRRSIASGRFRLTSEVDRAPRAPHSEAPPRRAA